MVPKIPFIPSPTEASPAEPPPSGNTMPLLPGHRRLQFSTLLSERCSSSCPALLLRRRRKRSRPADSNGPRLHAGRARAPSGLLRASGLEKPTAEDLPRGAKGSEDSRTRTPPSPARECGRRAGATAGKRGPARAPRATEGTRRVPDPLSHPRPGEGHPAHRPLPALERKVPAGERTGRGEETARQGRPRGQRDKKDTHPPQPRALAAPEIVTSPLPR